MGDRNSDNHVGTILQASEGLSFNNPVCAAELGIHLEEDISGVEFLGVFCVSADNALGGDTQVRVAHVLNHVVVVRGGVVLDYKNHPAKFTFVNRV